MTTSSFTLKNFAYQTVKSIQSDCDFDLKRSYIYELFACYEGYASYAAFLSGSIIINVQYDNSKEYKQHRLLQTLTLDILNRPVKSNFDNDFAHNNWDEENDFSHDHFDEDDVSWDDLKYQEHLSWDNYEGKQYLNHIQKLLKKLSQLLDQSLSRDFLLRLLKVIYREFLFLELSHMNLKSLRITLNDVNFEDGLLSSWDDPSSDFIDYDNSEYVNFRMIEHHLPDLQKFIAKGNKDAIAIMAKYYLYLANQIGPYGLEGSNFGAVWNNEKMRYVGKTQAKIERKKFDELVLISQKYQNMIKNFPIDITEVDFDKIEITSIQLKYLANQGNLEAVEYLLDRHEQFFKETDKIEAWTYVYFAQKFGLDFTKEDYYGIDTRTGERLGVYEYVDYTPVMMGGRDAIQLPELNDTEHQYALEQAEEIIRRKK
jgi:hypothetical protein